MRSAQGQVIPVMSHQGMRLRQSMTHRWGRIGRLKSLCIELNLTRHSDVVAAVNRSANQLRLFGVYFLTTIASLAGSKQRKLINRITVLHAIDNWFSKIWLMSQINKYNYVLSLAWFSVRCYAQWMNKAQVTDKCLNTAQSLN